MNDPLRKKWIVIIYVDVEDMATSNIQGYMENVKQTIKTEDFDEFLETKTMLFYVPVRDRPTTFEFHEIILNEHGYDIYEKIVEDKNLKADQKIDKLKEILKETLHDIKK